MRKIPTRSQTSTERSAFFVVAIAILILIVGYVLQRVNFDLHLVSLELTKPDTIAYITGILVSISVGVLASIIYSRYQSRSAERIIETIHSVGYDDLIDSLINQVAGYRGVFLTSYRLSILLRSSQCGRYIKVRQSYEYKKTLGSASNILMRFKRLSTEEEGISLYSEPTLLSEDYKRYEFFFKLNDAQFLEKGISNDEINAAYRIGDVKVDGIPCELLPEVGMPDTYIVNLPAVETSNGERKLEYVVEYPIDWNDYIFILFEYPAREIKIDFDYSSISNNIYFHRVEFLGYELGFSGRRGDSEGTMSITHNGWLLPKSGVIYIWYNKNTPERIEKKTATRRRPGV